MSRPWSVRARAETQDVLRDPVLCAWIAGAAVASYVLTYAIGGTRLGYWLRISFVLLPMLLVFVAATRRGAAEHAQEQRLLRSQPVREAEMELGALVGSAGALLAYLALVAPQAVVYAVVVPRSILPMLGALATAILLLAGIALVGRAIARRWHSRARLVDAAVFAFLFLVATAVAMVDVTAFPLQWLLSATPSGAAVYAAGAVVDVTAERLPALATLLCWVLLGVVLLVPSVPRKGRVLLAAGLLLGAGAAGYATAASVEPADAKKSVRLDSDFAFDVMEDGQRLRTSTNLPTGKATVVTIRMWGDRPTTAPSVVTFEAQAASLSPSRATIPAGSGTVELEVAITPLPGATPVDEKHVLFMNWTRDDRVLTGRFLFESEHPAFKPAIQLSGVLPIAPLVLLVARGRAGRGKV